VVDARNFLDDYYSSESLQDREQAMNEADGQSIVDLLVDQVECANVILINKTDAVNADELDEVRGIVKALNP
jgi:G3E family GTPase